MEDAGRVSQILQLFPRVIRDGEEASLAASPSYVYFGIILETFGKEKLVAGLWEHLARVLPKHEDQLLMARRLREGLLKASPLVGFPRGINGLAALRSSILKTSPQVQATLDQDQSLRAPVPKDDRIARGKEFWAKVYRKVNERILENMGLMSGGDLSEFAVTCIYGDLMAETSILSEKDTGLLEFAACFASAAAPQARGHMYGSRNLGNSRDEIQAVVVMTREIAELVGVVFDESEMVFLETLSKW